MPFKDDLDALIAARDPITDQEIENALRDAVGNALILIIEDSYSTALNLLESAFGEFERARGSVVPDALVNSAMAAIRVYGLSPVKNTAPLVTALTALGRELPDRSAVP